jgi:hypothetical protein
VRRLAFLLAPLLALAAFPGSSVMAAPTLQNSIYLRGYDQSGGRAVAVDPAGDVYVAGSWDDGTGHNGGFVLKLDPTGKTVLWRDEFDAQINAITVDRYGNAYIAGSIASTGYWPVLNAYQSTPRAATSAVVAKLDPTGRPVFSTYLGGTSDDTALGIAVNGAGQVFVVGSTGIHFPLAAQLPTSLAFGGAKPGSLVGFATKLAATGRSILWSTTFGDVGTTSAYSVVAQRTGSSAYVAVSTGPGDTHFPATYEVKGFNPANPSTAIVMLTRGKHHLVLGYSVRTNDSCPDCGGLAVGPGGKVVAAMAQRVIRLNSAGTAITWSRTTALPNGISGNLRAIALAPSGTITVTGAIDDPALSAEQPLAGTPDTTGDGAYIGRLDPNGKLLLSTYIPGAWGYGVAVGGAGNAIVTGIAEDTNLPTVNDTQDGPPIPSCPSPSDSTTTQPAGQCPTAFVSKLVG